MDFDALLKLLIAEIDVERIRSQADAIHSSDRWSSYDRYHETSELLLDMMRDNKLRDLRKITTPADGKTIVGDWLMPLAWDARAGTVTVTGPRKHQGKVLADYQVEPNHLVRWSAPTPPGGVTADVVDVGSGEDRDTYATGNVAGKIVLISGNVCEAKALAVEYGAIGIISDMMPVPHPDNDDAVGWHNVFSTDQNWGPAAGEPDMWAFILTPRDGRWLRRLMARSKRPVRLHAEVDATLYEGTTDTITGRLRGKEKPGEEVWVYTHMFECGADDNAAAPALTQEVLGTLGRLIREGRLPPLRRSIRHIAGWEWIGSTVYLDDRKRDLDKVIATMNLDCVGLPRSETGQPVQLIVNPHAQSSYTDALMLDLWERYARLRSTTIPAREARYGRPSDTQFCDPVYNIPTVFPYATVGRLCHNSHDVAALHDPEMYRIFAATAGAFLYTLASAAGDDCNALANIAYARAIKSLVGKLNGTEPLSKTPCVDALDYAADRQREAIRSVSRLAPRSTKVKKHAAMLVDRMDDWLATERQGLDDSLPDTLPERVTAENWQAPLSMADVGRLQPRPELSLFSQVIPSRGRACSPFWLPHLPAEQAKRDISLLNLWAFYWMDGKRDLLEIDRLVTHETGKPIAGGFLRVLRRLESYGYVDLRWRKTLTRRQIAAAARRLGVRRGDVLFVHSALASLGDVAGGSDAVIDGLHDVIGPRGTLAMPTFTYSKETPVSGAGGPPYHPQRTPSDVGIIPETFWRRPGVRRSSSASHSIAAVGPQAAFLTIDDVATEPYCREGAFGKLYELDAKVLMLGCGLAPNSCLHAVEDWVGLPSMQAVDHLIEGDDGNISVVHYQSEPVGPREFYLSSQVVTKSEVLFRQRGIINDGQIGPAMVQMFGIRDVIDASMAIIRDEDPCFLFHEENAKGDSAPELTRYLRKETERRLRAGKLCFDM
jgi:aminoglycoside 3-N-acetyltransferase